MRILLFCLLFVGYRVNAQEFTAPLMSNPNLHSTTLPKKMGAMLRTEPITLPMFEDFHYYDESTYPTDFWWIDSLVYINNHFVAKALNKGVATFDVLNQYGAAYHTTDPWAKKYCDSLTSYYINLSDYDASDSLYLSFAYLAKGLGFSPKGNDSLLVYMTDSLSGWTLVDFVRLDTAAHDWQTKMIPMTNPRFFFNNFQFRIINRGTIGTSSSHWHIDNIYLNANRNVNDTQLTNVAFSIPATNLLNDFTAMPFKHFATDRNGFLASNFAINMYNSNYAGFTYNNLVSYTAKNALTGTTYGNNFTNFSLEPFLQKQFNIVTYNPATLSPDATGYLKIKHQFYFPPAPGDTLRLDDTIVQYQEFDNYFAYDDGSAEQAYYLNLAPSNPGKIAIEYACYVPDTLAGVAIQFARQVPSNEDKEFFIQIYKSIEIGGSGGELIYEEDGFYPKFGSEPQQYKIYPLKELVPLPVGIYFVVIMMPASGISDSLMIGLDKNRTGANHRYFNVVNQWESSLLEGTLMVRPIMSHSLLSGIENNPVSNKMVRVYPNPSQDFLYLEHQDLLQIKQYQIIDIQGKILLENTWKNEPIKISALPTGAYFLNLQDKNGENYTTQFVKK